jgi:hypothetical protein
MLEHIISSLAPRREQLILDAINRALEAVRVLRDEPRAPGEDCGEDIQKVINELTAAKGYVLFGEDK